MPTQMHQPKRLLIYVLLLCLCWFGARPASPQPGPQTYAAMLEVIYPGVALQRAGTSQWLTLRQGAQAPFGPGDALRTDPEGRALLQYEDVEVFILPETRYRLDAYRLQADGALLLRATLIEGILVQRSQRTNYADYVLVGQDVQVDDPAAFFGFWSGTGERDILAVAEGRLNVAHAGETYAVSAGQGFRARTPPDIAALEPPLNAARLVAEVDTICRAVVDTIGDDALLIRGGAGRGFIARGLLFPGDNIPLLHETTSSGWSRTQYRSGFGWILTLALERTPECADLPTLPNETQEPDLRSIVQVQQRELTYLEPFFGLPEDDPWFYLPR